MVDSQTQTEVAGSIVIPISPSSDDSLSHPLTQIHPSTHEKYIFEVSSNRLYPKSNLDCPNNGNNPEMVQHYQPRVQSTASMCSSPEPVNDNRLNGNNEALRECSDDDHLETLGRKVTEIINANGLSSPMDNGNSCNVMSHGYLNFC